MGWIGQLTAYAKTLGVEPITGRPGRPTTQGKNERFHQTLFRWLDKQPLASTCAELQAQVDEFDRYYNTQRGHEALAGRITPQQAWDATPVAEAPRPAPQPIDPEIPVAVSPELGAELPAHEGITDLSVLWEATATKASEQASSCQPKVTGSIQHPEATGTRQLRVYTNGVVNFAGTLFSVTRAMATALSSPTGTRNASSLPPPSERSSLNMNGHQQVPDTRPFPRPDTGSKTEPTSHSVTDVLRHQASPKS